MADMNYMDSNIQQPQAQWGTGNLPGIGANMMAPFWSGMQQADNLVQNQNKLRLQNIQNSGAQVDLQNKVAQQPSLQSGYDLTQATNQAKLGTLPLETQQTQSKILSDTNNAFNSDAASVANRLLQIKDPIIRAQVGSQEYSRLRQAYPQMNLPVSPSPTQFSDQYLQGIAQGGVNTIPQQQHIQALKVPAAAEVASAKEHAGATRFSAKTSADAQIQAANIRKDYENHRTDEWIATKTNLQQKKQQVIAEMGKYANSHQPVPAGLLAQYRLLGSQEANEYMHWQMQTNPSLMSEMDPKTYQAKIKSMRDAYKGMQEDTLREALGQSYPSAPTPQPAPQQKAPGGAGWSIVKH